MKSLCNSCENRDNNSSGFTCMCIGFNYYYSYDKTFCDAYVPIYEKTDYPIKEEIDLKNKK